MVRHATSSDDARLTRRIWMAAIALIVIVGAFAAYYYYDRYVAPSGAVKTPDPIAQLEEQVRKDPNSVDLRLALSENYLLYRRYTDAIQTATEILNASPKNERALLVAGVAYALNGQPKEALVPLEKSIAVRKKAQGWLLDTGLEAALYYQGDSFIKLGRPADAIAPLKQAISINPTDADALHLLGTAYAGAGKHAKAIPALQKAVALVPDFSEAYEAMAASFDARDETVLGDYARAMVVFSAKDYEAARDDLIAVVARQKDFGPAHLGLGLAYEQLSDLKNARASLKTAARLMPTSVAVQQALGRVEATIQQDQGGS